MDSISISNLRQQAAKVIDQVATGKGSLVVMKRSHPQVVLASHDYFTSLEQAVIDLTDALEAESAKKEPQISLQQYVSKRWPKGK